MHINLSLPSFFTHMPSEHIIHIRKNKEGRKVWQEILYHINHPSRVICPRKEGRNVTRDYISSITPSLWEEKEEEDGKTLDTLSFQ